MKITGTGYEINKYINETPVSRGKERAEKTSTQGSVALESKGDDIVNLSDASKEVQKAREVIESEPDIRLEKVRGIQEEISKETYKIDYDQTAEKMLGYFIDEIVG